MQLAYLDEGDPAAPPVLFLHGEPTWSFLWRKVFPPVRDAGFRCVVPDLAGFGRSDKPTDVGWYTYDRHTALLAAFLEHLELRGTTLVAHDWGGPIGLRLFVEERERFDRAVLMNTGIFTGRQAMSEGWLRFRDFVARADDPPIGLLISRACSRDLVPEVIAAYEAPFDGPETKAGAKAFPAILPTSPEMPGAAEGQRTLDALRADPRPMLILWGEDDPALPVEAGRALAAALGQPEPELIAGASHFLQEDAGEQVGRRIAAWLASHA